MFGVAMCQRCAGTPVQHLTGEQAFRRITLQVLPGVFVPRPETEVLVEHAIAALADGRGDLVVDVGTGTGAIALAIKQENPRARVYATDRSPEAVELASANASRLGLEVTVLEGDLLQPLPPELMGQVDLVVSNPPYVAPEELEDLPAEVLADPLHALSDPQGAIYERLAEQALMWLRSGGTLAVEIDARGGREVSEIFGRGLRDVRVEPDLAGRDRVVLARAP